MKTAKWITRIFVFIVMVVLFMCAFLMHDNQSLSYMSAGLGLVYAVMFLWTLN